MRELDERTFATDVGLIECIAAGLAKPIDVYVHRPDIHESVANIVRRAMAFDPDDRFQNVAKLESAMRRFSMLGVGVVDEEDSTKRTRNSIEAATIGNSGSTDSMQVLNIAIKNHLTEERLLKALAPVNAYLDRDTSARCGVVIDILKMTGYARDASAAFAKWHQESRHRLRGVVVVTNNKLWSMVIAAIGIATGLRAFESVSDAMHWMAQIEADKGWRSSS